MTIFDRFSSRDELIKALEGAIQTKKGDDGTETFFIADESQSNLSELQTKLADEVKESQKQRKRAQAAEADLKEARQENARLVATNEEFSKYNPEKQREEINRLLAEVGNLKADNKSLSEQIEPLNKVIADYKGKENDRLIDQEIVKAATELGVRPEAMKDVMYQRSMLEVSDLGIVQTKGDAVPVRDFIKSEFDASPLWHPRSEGGGSHPGTASGGIDSQARYSEAKSKGDFGGMCANAPAFQGVTTGPNNKAPSGT